MTEDESPNGEIVYHICSRLTMIELIEFGYRQMY